MNFQGALNHKLSTFNNAVLYLTFMWQAHFQTKWSHSWPPLNTCASSPIFCQSFHLRRARWHTTRWHSPFWPRYTHAATWDGDIPQWRSPNRLHSTNSFFWGWWLVSVALFATPQHRQLSRSILDMFQCKTQLNNILQRRLSVPNANANNRYQLYELIADMEEVHGLVCGWEERSVNIEEKVTSFWYRNPLAATWLMAGHSPFRDHLSYLPVKQMDSIGECMKAEMWTTDWWWKTQASFLVGSERLFLVRFLLCLGELVCQRQHVREIMSERSSQRDHVREIISERSCQRDHVREIMSERSCQRDHVREIM